MKYGFGRVRACRSLPSSAWVGSGLVRVLRFCQILSGRSWLIIFSLGCIADGKRWSDLV